jgi:ABC-type nitrate/sulfonate/bicarbonate transport system ATPase subunit
MKLIGASFSYGEKIILQNFSLTLPDQGFTALSGPSGSGKTTLLRLIAGLEPLQHGTWEGPAPQHCAMLFQENRLLPGLPVSKQVEVVLPKGADPTPYLEAVGLEGEENTLPAALSGGMQRRLALARLLAYGREKQLLLLDEPFTGVDPPRAAQIMDWLRRQNQTVLLAAHDGETLSLCDEVIRLSGPPLRVETASNVSPKTE